MDQELLDALVPHRTFNVEKMGWELEEFLVSLREDTFHRSY